MIPTLSLLLLASLSPQSPAEPEWIWGRAEPKARDACLFRHEFDLSEDVAQARLVVSCDNDFVAFVNGQRVATGQDWQRPVGLALKVPFNRGRNLIAVRGRNVGGPAGMILRLDLKLASGATRQIVTDSTWRTSFELVSGWHELRFDASGWQPAHSFGVTSDHQGPWGDVLVERVATPAESLTVADGYVVELVRSAQLGEGSWVCLTFDPRGRLIVSPQRGSLLRMTLDDEGGADVETLDVPIGNAQGLLHANDSLFVNVNDRPDRNGGLWRLRDLDGDDSYEDVRRMSIWGPGGEHGPHAVAQGPDGKIWVINGNMTSLPRLAPTSPHRNYAEDILLPRVKDPRGHAVSVKAPGSSVLRIDPEGGPWELMASGMRNAYDLAFNADGELFTFDSDMEWDIGVPWYRPTRVVHLVSGGEYGWRTGSGKWPAWYPDSLPAAVDVGVSSPTGVAFGTNSHFPGKYRSALFAGDWAYGRILAVHLEPSGASYVGGFEEFVKGSPLNVTDFEFGPDGAMYFTTGGRGTQSGLYRVRALKPTPVAAPAPTTPSAAVALRRELEALHGQTSIEAIEAAWPHLDSPDRWIRYVARVAVERQELDHVRVRALSEGRLDAALEGLLALARVGEAADRAQVLDRLGELGEGDLSDRQRSSWLRVHDVCLARGVELEPAQRQAVVDRLAALFPAASYQHNRELARLLIHLDAEVAVDRTMALLRASSSEVEQMRYAFDLRNARRGWTPALREEFFEWIRRARSLKGGPSLPGYVARIGKDAAESMPEGERAAWLARLEEVEQPSLPEVTVDPDATYHNWTMEELRGSLDEVGSGRSFATGEAAYEKALCAVCHRFGAAGGSLGPDLSGASRRFTRADLLEAILLPSKVISDQYASVVVTTRGGDPVVGRLVDEDADKLVMATGAYGTEKVEVAKSDVRSIEASPVSAMPPALLSGLSREAILDLLAYIESGGDSSSPQFKK